jgi:eukaryotic-like serine/threonine-protein kinase
MIGRVLTRYKILEEVGHGGMAVVYKGLDTTLGREVAVKVLHPHLAGHQESRARLEREAQAVAKLHHDNILEIFDYSGPDSPESFIVTEFIHGPTLTTFLKDHPIPLPEVAAMIASEVARALEHAHGLGVIHRDVKPENVMIRADGIVKLTDFGIAQIVDKERMTVTGQLLGSPAYMSPEHVEGGRLDFRTDVFACGILLYQLATGQLPFRGKNPHEVLKKIADCHFTPADQANPLVSPVLTRIISKALAKSPDARYPDVAAMRNALCDELATSGVDDPRAELAKFFADPVGWEKTFRPRLVASLAAAGRKAASRGRTALALASWSRALAIDPASVEVQALIEGLAARRRYAKIAGGAGFVVALVAAALAGFHYLKPPPRTPDAGHPPGIVANDPIASAPAGPPAVPPGSPTANPPPLMPSVFRPRPHVVKPPPVAASRTIEVNLGQPNNTLVSVDGKPPVPFDGKSVTVPAGKHVLTFSNACCTALSIPVAEDQTRIGPHKQYLPWLNGRLTVKTSPDDALIEYTPADGKRRIGRGGHVLPVTFGHDYPSNEMLVTVSVSAPGFQTQVRKCTARAGEAREYTVELERAN